MKIVLSVLLMAFCFTSFADSKQVNVKNEKKSDTADWYKDEECRMIFFTVLEGLYRDGVPDEVVNRVIGRVQKNSVEKRFVFKCKLCHACYEAFAVYQRRPAFSGTKGVKAIGNKKIPDDVMKNLADDVSDRTFGRAFSTIIQPWIKQKLLTMNLNEKQKIAKMKKFADLAAEGNALITTYKTCQACDAIEAVSKIMKK